MSEYQSSSSFKIERFGAGYVECFLEQLLPVMLNYSKAEKIKSIDDIFTPLDPIIYSQSSNYNLYLRYYSLSKQMAYKDVRINLRELLNLFIADGLFKSQTNYMNSKLNISDIQIMCQYIAYKIQTQNYLNLVQIAVQQQKEPNIQIDDKIQIKKIRHLILKESQDFQGLHVMQKDNGDGQVYTMILNKNYQTFHTAVDQGQITEENLVNRIILQLQIFQSQHKVQINQYDPSKDRFSQKEMYFNQAQDLVPFFTQLVNAGSIMEALRRLALNISIQLS